MRVVVLTGLNGVVSNRLCWAHNSWMIVCCGYVMVMAL